MFVGVAVVSVSVVLFLLQKFFKSIEKQRPVALNPSKKISFEMIEKEVCCFHFIVFLYLANMFKLVMTLFFYLYV